MTVGLERTDTALRVVVANDSPARVSTGANFRAARTATSPLPRGQRWRLVP